MCHFRVTDKGKAVWTILENKWLCLLEQLKQRAQYLILLKSFIESQTVYISCNESWAVRKGKWIHPGFHFLKTVAGSVISLAL